MSCKYKTLLILRPMSYNYFYVFLQHVNYPVIFYFLCFVPCLNVLVLMKSQPCHACGRPITVFLHVYIYVEQV